MNTQNIEEILVDAKQLLTSLKLASMAVIEKKEVLNQINFFPVTDKDTGENLAVTLQAVHEIPISVESCDKVLQRVSQSIFEHARGNSGVIFSIWFSGLERTKHSSVTYSWVQIKQIFHASTVYLCEQMEQVVPGTMVSLLEQFAKVLLDVKAQNEVPQQLRALLEATRDENQVLASHGVVDAGALGITIFLEHFFESLFKQAAGEPLVDGHTKTFETDDPI